MFVCICSLRLLYPLIIFVAEQPSCTQTGTNVTTDVLHRDESQSLASHHSGVQVTDFTGDLHLLQAHKQRIYSLDVSQDLF